MTSFRATTLSVSGPRRRAVRSHRTVPFALAVALGLPALGLAATAAAPSLAAQGRASAPPRPRAVSLGPCDELRGAPPELVRVPEGIAVVRLQRDLETLEELARAPEVSADDRSLRDVRRLLEATAQSLAEAVAATERSRDGDAEELTAARRVALRRIRDVQPALAAAMRDAERAAAARPLRRGWLGLNISSVAVREEAGDLLRYCDYPVIESVDPGSPAERAGLAAGDSLRAFDGRDLLAAPVDMTALLRPGRVVRVGIRREGRARELPVTVAERTPRSLARSRERDVVGLRGNVRIVVRVDSGGARGEPRSFIAQLEGDTILWQQGAEGRGEASAPSVFFWRGDDGPLVASAPRFPGAVGFVRRDSLGRPAATAGERMVPARARGVVAPPPPVVLRATLGADDGLVAGAQLTTVGAELRDALGLPAGLLVLRVLDGTPAADGGLRGGDVLLEAGGRPLQRVRDLAERFERAEGERRLLVRVRRGSDGDRLVTLRW